jgi:hypothetical protein
MRKKTIITATLLFLLLPAIAQHSLLYKISGKGLTQPSYLYGTIHMICPDDFSVSDQLKDVFSKAKTLYLEVDMDDPAMMGQLMQAMQEKTEGYKLENIFKPEDFARLKQYFKDSMKMDLAFFQQMKPMMILSTMLSKSLDCPQPASYEVTFLNMAKEQQKTVEGLEGLDAQINVFDRIADSTESRMIMEYVNDMQKQRDIFARIVSAYQEQDIQKIHDFLKESPEMAGYEDVFVYDRNRSWIPVIEKAAQKESTLFACGAMHLGGDQGVVALLRKQGYTVEPLPNDLKKK